MMNGLEALILGIIQGLTEFLPVSSSGHLEIAKALLHVEVERSLMFTVAVHGATVLSTIVVFRKDIVKLLRGLCWFRWNEETSYVARLIISMIPVGFVGLFFKEEVKMFFGQGNVALVGVMLFITSGLLIFTYIVKPGKRKITFTDALIIGVAQAFAVMPGISRSGATIATGMLIGNDREKMAKFSFLMVLLPIMGENMLELFSGEMGSQGGIEVVPLIIGFVAAFVTGLLACRWMIRLVSRGRLIYFGLYCLVAGVLAIWLA